MSLCFVVLDSSFLLMVERSLSLEIGKRCCCYRRDEGTEIGGDFIDIEGTSQPETACRFRKHLLDLRPPGWMPNLIAQSVFSQLQEKGEADSHNMPILSM